MDDDVSPDLNTVFLQDVQAPRWADCCAFPPGRFGVCGPWPD